MPYSLAERAARHQVGWRVQVVAPAGVGRHLFIRSLKGDRKKGPENVRIHTLDELYE
jgi:hypothetical protein